MKKTILFMLVTMAAVSTSFAQKEGKTKFSIGPELAWATSNPLSDIPGNKGWGLGFGGSVQVEHFFQEKVSGTFYAGVIAFAGRSADNSSKNKGYTTVPIRAGINYYVGDRFHLGAQLGVGINSWNDSKATAFSYSPQIGYNFSRNEKPLDLTLKYDGYAGHGGFSAIGLRLSLIL
ncbi:MAG: outer membrane beta-barrel protein [Ginsengibacter sp.]